MTGLGNYNKLFLLLAALESRAELGTESFIVATPIDPNAIIPVQYYLYNCQESKTEPVPSYKNKNIIILH